MGKVYPVYMSTQFKKEVNPLLVGSPCTISICQTARGPFTSLGVPIALGPMFVCLAQEQRIQPRTNSATSSRIPGQK